VMVKGSFLCVVLTVSVRLTATPSTVISFVFVVFT
jgi:hypothetical protein